jgi:hypothetical protein
LKINGAPKTVHSFKPNPKHDYQSELNVTSLPRCYFMELSGEILASGANQGKIVMAQRNGLVSSGA